MFRQLFQNLKSIHPIRLTFLGYFSYVLIGWLSLCIPWSQQAAGGVSALDNLFIATSAVSTTGLATVAVDSSYSFLGELFILIMIQFGGIGYMTLGSFIMLTRSKKLPEVQENISRTTFSLPREIPIEAFIKQVFVFTALIESIGVVALFFIFRQAGVEHALWQAIFHSISAFCTAGFSLFGDGLEPFRDNFWLNATISTLSYAGAVGFLVWTDFILVALGKKPRMTLTSKIILHTTVMLTLCGTAAFMILEPTISAFPAEERLMASFFQTMTALTTVGFNTIPIGGISEVMIITVGFLMLIGASPSGTGGGLKSTTFTILVGILRSTLRNQPQITFREREIPEARIRAAASALIIYAFTSLVAIFLLTILDNHLAIEDLFFEVISAVSTVGISRGITSSLEPLGKLVIIAAMFAGRLGPLVFGVALFMAKPEYHEQDKPREDIVM